MYEQIKNHFSKNVITINQEDSLSQADEMMNNYNIRHLPVVDQDNTLVGILSKSDFVALKYVDSRLKDFKVRTFMSAPVKAIRKTTKIREVAKLFVDKKISSVVVVNEKEVIGILTSEDLIRLLAGDNDYLNETEQLDLAALADDGWISMTTLTQ